MDDSSKDGEAIHKCDTIPPPDGEDDPYAAPTKVGPMARKAVEQMMAQAEAAESRPPPKSSQMMRRPVPPPLPRAIPPTRSNVEARPAASTTSAPPAPVPRIVYEEDAEQGDLLDPTSLFGAPQSGATVLLDVSLARAIQGLPSPGASAPRVAPELVVAQLAADRSHAPRRRSSFSDAELVVAVIAFAAVLVPALYFVFFRM